MIAGEAREGSLVFARLRELYDQPLRGAFDLAHLQATHAYIFQDLPHHRPGVVRSDTDNWTKNRVLEGQSAGYAVPYVSQDVAGAAGKVLASLGGAAPLRGLDADAFATKLSNIYGALDRAHCFYEGNSRTLREFTRTLALEAGYDLDWAPSGANAATRNRLYLARDLAVLDRAYPGLTEERAMKTNDRQEYEAWFLVRQVRAMSTVSLQSIIQEGLQQLPGAGIAAEETGSPIQQQFARFRAARAAAAGSPAEAPKYSAEAEPRPAAPRSDRGYDPRP